MNNGENGITNNHSRRTFVKSAVGVLGTTAFDVSALNAIALADGKGILMQSAAARRHPPFLTTPTRLSAATVCASVCLLLLVPINQSGRERRTCTGIPSTFRRLVLWQTRDAIPSQLQA
jgi:hypothetical protein